MNYHNILHNDMRNGAGIRAVLFVAGCAHHCRGCHNPQTWAVNGGIPFDEDAKRELFDAIAPDYVDGVTFSGGDPLHPANRETVLNLCAEIKRKFKNKTVWVYTGYTYEDVADILHDIDVIVDGEFIKELADPAYHWAGSTNQRIIKLC